MKTDPLRRRLADRQALCPFRVTLFVILVATVVFVFGRATGPRFTISEAEAAPVPRELPFGIERFHDASNGVTCWRTGGTAGGVSCLPDQWLTPALADEGAP